MAGYILKTPTKIPPDKDDLYDASPMQLSIKSKALAAADFPEDIYLQEKDKHKSIANLKAILNLIEVQECLEKDAEILAVLANQKANLNEILIQKSSGKKGSFKTAEKEAFSQLQNQVSCLEKSVDEKFQAILKSIENQPTTNWAQVANQDNQNKQEQQTVKPAPAAKVAQKQSPKQIQKQTQKESLESYQARRLILHVQNEIWKDFNSYSLRNQINNIFLEKENIADPVIASVTRSKTGASVILTTMSNFSADFLLEKQQIWEDIFSQNLKFIEKSTNWYKIVVHGVPVMPFSMDDGLTVLKDEIETFNSGLKLLRNPSWLTSEENRQTKRHASIVFAVDSEEQAQKAVRSRLYIAGEQLIAESYKSAEAKTQCQKCQRLGHSTRDCINQECCQICAGKHHTRLHKCNICQTMGVECPHAKLKCRNCGENHRANSQICSFWKKQPVSTNLPASPAKSDVAMREVSSDFAVVINNVKLKSTTRNNNVF